MSKPKVVTLCGSTRFREDFEAMAAQLTLDGYIVLMPHVWVHDTDVEISAEAKLKLDELHLHKIDLADEVIIVAPKGYVGASTQKELDYATRIGKEIGWSHGEPMVEHTDREEERISNGFYE